MEKDRKTEEEKMFRDEEMLIDDEETRVFGDGEEMRVFGDEEMFEDEEMQDLGDDEFLGASVLRAILEHKCLDDSRYREMKADLLRDEETGKYYVEHSFSFNDDLLYNHLLAEELYEHRAEVDWVRVTDGYDPRIVGQISHLLTSPLVWYEVPQFISQRFVVTGGLAGEYDGYISGGDRLMLCNNLAETCPLWFVDTMPTKKDIRMSFHYHRVPDDMVLWDRLMMGTCRYEIPKDLTSPQKPIYRPWSYDLQDNLKRIVKHRGVLKAIEIVEQLRADWPDIVAMKLFEFGKMSASEVEDFRLGLFEGLERTLRGWKAEAKVEEKKALSEPMHVVIDNVDAFVGKGIGSVSSVYPRERDYISVVEWLEKKKQQGEDFYAGSGYNRTEMCRKLTKIFGWEVNENSLRKAQKQG